MAENSLSSFTMLSEHLHELFIDYIISGRIRAPPEAELIEMLPTFQYGAKTDRRALQCKFKSWAKRMSYENGYLMLVSDGKIIIPQEKCEALVMHMHSEEHNDVEDVIAKVNLFGFAEPYVKYVFYNSDLFIFILIISNVVNVNFIKSAVIYG